MENDSCRETRLTEENEQIYARLAELDREIRNLCEGYSIVNRRFSAVLELRKDLASNATAAAIRSAAAARKAADACTNAAKAAQVAADHAVIDAAESAACGERKCKMTRADHSADTHSRSRRRETRWPAATQGGKPVYRLCRFSFVGYAPPQSFPVIGLAPAA